MVRRVAPLLVLIAGCSEYNVAGHDPAVAADNPTARLEITPASHDFGTLDIPCDDAVEITLTSAGEADLEITALDYQSGGLLALDDGGLQLPLTLPPGESATVRVVATASEPLADFGVLEVTSNDADKPVRTAEQAVEAEGRMVMESFYEPGIPPVDILFLIDQSGSMATLADDNIRAGMPDFINTLQGIADWQLIEVTKGDGCANGGIITPSTPNAAQLLSDNAFNVLVPGLYSEQLLKHAEKALSLTDPGECNAGFLRQGASLHIIVASDEAEQSFQPWSHWLNEYYNYVTNPQYVTVSGIINLQSDDACSGGNGGSPDGYIDIINATGGVALDICQPGWGSQLTDIATATVAGMRVYNLSEDAVPGTLTVLVNGQPATDWEFSDAANSVTIHEPPIGEGDIVEIGYGVYAECAP